jgi:hypothetical protein
LAVTEGILRTELDRDLVLWPEVARPAAGFVFEEEDVFCFNGHRVDLREEAAKHWWE